MVQNQSLMKTPATIIAPGALHLPLYARIHEKLGDTTNIQLLGLDTWLRSQVEFPASSNLELIYQYRNQLQNLNPENSYFESRTDYDFLRSCLRFMEKFFLYQMKEEDLPDQSAKEKDLKEIVHLLSEIPLIEHSFAECDFEHQDLSSVWILERNFMIEEQKIIERLKAGGAQILSSLDDLSVLKNPPRPVQLSSQKEEKQNPASESPDQNLPADHHRYYWSASNPRTQMEVIADTIISENMNADDIYIVLSRPEDASVLQQVFDARKIPLTILNTTFVSPILTQWKTALTFTAEKSRENLIDLLKAFYPQTTGALREYLELFPEGSHLADLNYEANPVISEHEFETMKSMELQMQPWLPLFEKMKTWKADEATMMDIAELIQQANPNPSEDDLRIFDGVCRAYGNAAQYIHSESDLPIFIHHLNSLYPSSALEECSGALAGSRDEISPLFGTVFYTGADAAHFPCFEMNSGIFDESYMQKIRGSYPDLSQRLEQQRKNLFHALSLPKDLYVTVPQADYEGKSADTSYEMFTWMNAHPKFQVWKDSSWYIKPDFSLSEDISSQLFFRDQKFTASLSSLNSYELCPLQHLLKYGMKLHKPYEFEDQLKVRADILRDVIESASLWFHRPIWELDETQIRFLVSRQFEFARRVFAGRQEALQILELEYVRKISEMVKLLAPITKNLNASLVPEKVEVQMSEDRDGMQMEIEGSVNSPSSKKTAFTLMNAQGQLDLSSQEIVIDLSAQGEPEENSRAQFHEAMAALDVSLSQKPVKNRAFAISMGRGKKPVTASPVGAEQIDQEFITQFLKNSVKGQNMPESDTFEGEVIRKKTPSYEKTMEKAKTAAEDFVSSLKNGCILPLHKPNACKFCAYRSICRNGSQERTQESTAAALAEYARKREKETERLIRNRQDAESVSSSDASVRNSEEMERKEVKS